MSSNLTFFETENTLLVPLFQRKENPVKKAADFARLGEDQVSRHLRISHICLSDMSETFCLLTALDNNSQNNQ